MNDKKNVGSRTEAFLNGKGFYIVLFVCMAVIGISAGIFMFAENKDEQIIDGTSQTVPGSIIDIDSDLMTGLWEDESSETISGTEVGEETSLPLEEENEDTAAPIENSGSESMETASPKVEELTFVWPITGDIVNNFSDTELVYNKTMADWRTHEGIDISAQIGTRVMAVADGTVTEVYADDLYGTTVTIDHGNGLLSVYSNLAAVPTVAVGDYVAKGLVIGAVGDTAIAETNEVQHLHFAMVKSGVPVDPAEYMPTK